MNSGGPPKQTQKLVPGTGSNPSTFVYVDVELHGEMVPLLALKKLIGRKGLKQADIAAATAPFNGGKAFHQSTVSNYLTGSVLMPQAVAQALESLITPSEAASLATKASVPLNAATTPKPNVTAAKPLGNNGGNIPSFAKTLNSIPDDDGDPNAPWTPKVSASAKATTPPTPVFVKPKLPEEEFAIVQAQQICSMVRKANEGEQLAATFSLRKLGLWGQAYVLLRTEKFSHAEAMAGGFHLAVLGKSVGEEKQFLMNAYQQVFATEAKLPLIKPKTGTIEAEHQMMPLIRPIIEACLPLWLVGPTGSGKTHALQDVARQIGREYFRIQGTGDTSTDDLLGGFAASGGTTRFEYGPLPLAMKAGGILNFDEPTVVPAEVLFELQAVLEGKPLVIKKNRGEVVHAQPGFTLVVGDNTVGLAEDASMVGTKVMNEAFRDRWLFARFDYMPEDVERKAAMNMISSFARQQRERVEAAALKDEEAFTGKLDDSATDVGQQAAA